MTATTQAAGQGDLGGVADGADAGPQSDLGAPTVQVDGHQVIVRLTGSGWTPQRIMAGAHALTDWAWVGLGRDATGALCVSLRLRAAGSEAPTAGAGEAGSAVSPAQTEALQTLGEDCVAALTTAVRREGLEARARATYGDLVTQALTGAEASAPDARDAAGHVLMAPRLRAIGDGDGARTVVTHDLGGWALLNADQARALEDGRLTPDDPAWATLAAQGFVGDGLPRDAALGMVQDRLGFVHQGPHLHVAVVTLRCDHSCQYCHAARAPMTATDADMTPEVADAVIDRMLASPSPFLTLEFQGGEPLANFPIIQRMITRAEDANRTVGKALAFTLVSNMTFMDDAKLAWLLDHRVEICTSIDGPAPLHDAQRRTASGGAFAHASAWIGRINAAYVARGLDPRLYRIEALPTVTRATLDQPEALIDTYVALGCQSIFLRALNPYGFAHQTGDRLGYSMAEWLTFYRRALEYILTLNRRGVQLVERNAGIFLTKILHGYDPGFLDIRTPCGAGIGQVAYGQDGRVFTCDEGRMLDRMGDDIFCMGDVRTDDWQTLAQAPAVRAMVLSSTLDALPGCATCAYKPYCGVCPVHNYSEQGSLAGRPLESSWCEKHMGLIDVAFELLTRAASDPELTAILDRWTTHRDREHFVHRGDA